MGAVHITEIKIWKGFVEKPCVRISSSPVEEYNEGVEGQDTVCSHSGELSVSPSRRKRGNRGYAGATDSVFENNENYILKREMSMEFKATVD